MTMCRVAGSGMGERGNRRAAGARLACRRHPTLTGGREWCITYTRKRWSLSDLLQQLRHSSTLKGAQA